MKAAVIREFGAPDVLRIEDVADPIPGEGELVIGVRAVSVNRTLDCFVRAGTYAHKPELPHVLGVDPVGTVEAVGPGVTHRKAGERVVTSPIIGRTPFGAPMLLGVHQWGGYAELVRVPAANTHLIPESLGFPEACAAARHFPLAFAQLRDHGRVQPGDWVLVMGAAGGLGAAGVQAALYLGANVIAAAGAPERVAAACNLGAHAGIDYRAQDLATEVERITGGSGVAVVLENIGDPTLFPSALAALGQGGRLVTAGAHGGASVPLDVRRLYLRQLTLIGAPVESAADYHTSMRAVADGRMSVMIDSVMPLHEAAEAHRRVESGGALGKIMLTPTF